jgi:hypothetical protein
MPGVILAYQNIWTKLADGTVQQQVLHGGAVIAEMVHTAANITSMNTNVNGGATGASQTDTYAQDANKTDYHVSIYQGQ